MTIAITKSTRRNDGHPAQMKGPMPKVKPSNNGRNLGKHAVNRTSAFGRGKVSETPGKANR